MIRALRTMRASAVRLAARATLALAAALGVAPAGAQLLAPLAQVPWLDSEGRRIVIGSMMGERMVATMSYTACRKTCSTTLLVLREMQAILEKTGRRANFVIVTYDPERDSPAEWKRYREARGLDQPNWHFLTGAPGDTKRVAALLDLDYWKYDEHVMHDFRIVLFDRYGRWTRAITWDRIRDLEAELRDF